MSEFQKKIENSFEFLKKQYPNKKIYCHLATKETTGYCNTNHFGIFSQEELEEEGDGIGGRLNNYDYFHKNYIGGWSIFGYRGSDITIIEFYVADDSCFLDYNMGVSTFVGNKESFILPVLSL